MSVPIVSTRATRLNNRGHFQPKEIELQGFIHGFHDEYVTLVFQEGGPHRPATKTYQMKMTDFQNFHDALTADVPRQTLPSPY